MISEIQVNQEMALSSENQPEEQCTGHLELDDVPLVSKGLAEPSPPLSLCHGQHHLLRDFW